MSDVGAPFEAEFRLVGGEEDVLRLGRTLETVLQRAFAASGETFSKEMNKAVRGIFGPSGGTSGFAGATRQAGALNREMLRITELAELVQRRFKGIQNNAGAAFDADATALMTRNLQTLAAQTDKTADEIRQLGPEWRRAMQAVSENASRGLFGDLGAQQDLTRRLRTESNERIQASQNETRLAIAASKERIVQAQQEGSRILAETRAAGARRVALIQTFSRQLVQAENAVGAAFRGTASILRGVAGSIGTGLSGAAGLFRRQGSEIEAAMRDTARGVEFQSTRINRELTQNFSTSLDTRESKILRSFRTQEQIVNNSVTRQITSLQRLETRLESGVLGAATGRSAAAGALGFGGLGALAGGAGLAGLLTSGFQRFGELERLNKQFIALTGNAAQAASLMEQVKAFAITTPFDLVGVADLAKGFLAIGTAAEDVLPQVKTIADAVALTGGGTDELNRIQRAIGQVVSAGRLQGDELNQLAENLPGLNIRKILADQLTGGDVGALVKMQEAGELTADKFIAGLMTGLSTDPRLAGASEALGSTLTGRFANLKESFSDFGASLIGLVSGPMTFAFKQLGDAMATASRFIKGEDLSAGLDAIRTAAGGAALAIGGLVVAKAAAEALQILGSVVGRLLTPMGLLVGVVGIVGGAIAVLAKESPAFAEALRNTLGIMRAGLEVVGDVLGGVAKGIGDALGISISSIGEFGDFLAEKLQTVNDILFRFVGQRLRPILEGIVDFISGTLVPIVASGVRTVVSFIGDEVIPRVADFIGFVRSTAIPAVVSAFGAAFDFAREAMGKFVDFIGDSVVPAVADVAGALADFSLKAVDFVARFDEIFATVGGGLAGFAVGGPIGAAIGAGLGLIISNFEDVIPAVQPAIDAVTGFFDTVQKFGIGQAFTDLRDGLTKTIGNVASGVQDVFGRVLDGVQRAIRNTVDAVKRFIDRVDWGKVAGGVLQFVEETGRIVGRIATHPRFVGAIAAIVGAVAAAAALAAVRFGEGLIRGISSNLDDWMRIAFSGLGDALKIVFRFALEDLGRSLLLFFGGLFAVTTLRTVFSDYGKNAGNSFASGFTGALRGAGGTLPGFGSTTGGFLSALFGGDAALQRGLRRDADNLQKLTISEIDRMRATLGSFGRDPISIANIQLLNPKDLADTRVKVQQEFDKLVQQIGPGGVAATEVRNAAVGIGDAFRVALGRDVEGGIRARFAALNAAITEGGRTIVANAGTIGRSLAGAFASGLAGFQLGRAAGQSGGLLEVLLGIGSGAAIGFSLGGGPGAAIGASLAALGAAFGSSGKAAEAAAEQVKVYTDAVIAMNDETSKADLLRGFTDILESQKDSVIDTLADLGFHARQFTDALAAGQTGESFLADLLDDVGPQAREFARQLETGSLTLDDFRTKLFTPTKDVRALRDELDRAGISTQDFQDVLKFLDQQVGRFGDGADRAADLLRVTGDEAEDASGNLRLFSGAVDLMKNGMDDIIDKSPAAALGIDVISAAAAAGASTSEAYASALEGLFGAVEGGIPTTEERLREIEAGARRAGEAADRSREQMEGFLSIGTSPPLQEAIDRIIASLDGIPQALAELDLSGAVDSAKFRTEVDDFVEGFNQAISDGIASGEITSAPQIILEKQKILDALTAQLAEGGLTAVEAQFLLDVTLALNSVTTDPALVEGLDTEIAKLLEKVKGRAGIGPVGRSDRPVAGFAGGAIGNVVDVPVILSPTFTTTDPPQTLGADLVRQIAAGITAASGLVVVALRNVLDVAARVGAPTSAFYGTGATVGKAFAAGLGASAAAAASSVFTVVNAALRTAGSSYNAWYGVGQNIGKALGAGIASTINLVAQAAANVVRAAISAAQSAGKIKSPSRVFIGLGEEIGEGFAIGIENTTGTVAQAAKTMVESAVGGVTLNIGDQIRQGLKFEDGSTSNGTFLIRADGSWQKLTTAVQGATSSISTAATALQQLQLKVGDRIQQGMRFEDGSVSSSAFLLRANGGWQKLAADLTATLGLKAGDRIQQGMKFEDGSISNATFLVRANGTWERLATAVQNAQTPLPTASSANVAQIVEASGGTTTVNVSLSTGNIYGDQALEDMMVDFLNQVGQAVSTRPRVTVGFGNG